MPASPWGSIWDAIADWGARAGHPIAQAARLGAAGLLAPNTSQQADAFVGALSQAIGGGRSDVNLMAMPGGPGKLPLTAMTNLLNPYVTLPEFQGLHPELGVATTRAYALEGQPLPFPKQRMLPVSPTLGEQYGQISGASPQLQRMAEPGLNQPGSFKNVKGVPQNLGPLGDISVQNSKASLTSEVTSRVYDRYFTQAGIDVSNHPVGSVIKVANTPLMPGESIWKKTGPNQWEEVVKGLNDKNLPAPQVVSSTGIVKMPEPWAPVSQDSKAILNHFADLPLGKLGQHPDLPNAWFTKTPDGKLWWRTRGSF